MRPLNNGRNSLPLAISAIVLALVSLWGIFGHRKGQTSLDGGIVQRTVGTGVILPTEEPYRHSPFLIDLILSPGAQDEIVFYDRGRLADIKGEAEEAYRFYAASSGELEVKIKLASNRSERAPRILLYNDQNQLISGGKPRLRIPAAGLYRLVIAFQYESVDTLKLAFAIGTDKPKHYDTYLADSLKTIEFDIPLGQLGRLDEIRAFRRKLWAMPIGEDQDYGNALKPKERVLGRIKSRSGSWALATIGAAGRTSSHETSLRLPSMDIRVTSGSLPYGLKHFKLYPMPAKTDGRDLVLESVFKDLGVLMARGDLVKVMLNGSLVGFMELYEEIDDHFFEFAERAPGAVLGYSTDALANDTTKSRYLLESDFDPKSFPLERFPRISDQGFERRLCATPARISMALTLAYGGLHGLNQSDMKYYFDERKGCIEPIIKDLGSDVSSLFLREQFEYSFSYEVQTLSTYAPEWRPDLPSHSSYFRVWRAAGRSEKDENFSWWSVMPATLNYFLMSSNFAEFVPYYERFETDWSRARIQSRLSNLGTAAKQLKIAVITKPPLFFSEHTPPDKFQRAVKNERRYFQSGDAQLAGKLIAQASGREVEPDAHSLAMFAWRNELSREVLKLLESYHPEASKKSPIMGKAAENAATFLYRKETPLYSHLFFLERNLTASRDNSGFELRDSMGEEYKPAHVIEAGTNKPQLSRIELYLNDRLAPEENVRVYYFKIRRESDDYLYLKPHPLKETVFLGPRDMAIAPTDRKLKDNGAPVLKTADLFTESGNGTLKLKPGPGPITGAVIVPAGKTWLVDRPSELRFTKSGCLVIEGRLKVDEAASLALKGANDSGPWAGIHFRSSADQVIRNVSISGAGAAEEGVRCGDASYGGAVTFSDAKVELIDWKLSKTGGQAAVSLLKAIADIRNLQIDEPTLDGLRAESSVVSSWNIKVREAGRDGLAARHSNLRIDESAIEKSKGHNLLITENSRGEVSKILLEAGNGGLQTANAATVAVRQSRILRNASDLSAVISKPYYSAPELTVDSQTSCGENKSNSCRVQTAVLRNAK